MHITHINLFSLPVSDQAAAKAFYTEKVGFSVVRDDAFGEQRWIQVAPAGAQTSVTLVSGDQYMAPGSQQGIVLETNDVQADHAVLKANGVAISEMQNAPWGTFATFTDPDGNSWVLQQSTRM